MASSSPAGPPQPTDPPYRPQNQALGETPSIIPDVPICAVFLFIFIAAGAGHMFLLKRNQKRGKKFLLNGMVFGFCFTRIMANILRIAWANYPRSIQLGIAATIFVYAGIVLLFIGNLFFAQRIVRSQHPRVGWSTPFSLILPVLMAIVIGTILALIVAVIYSFYTLDENSLRRIRELQLYASTLFAVVAFLPVPTVLLSALRRRSRKAATVDPFGEGSIESKIGIVVLSGVLLTLGAAYRAGTSYLRPTPLMAAQPWYFSKASFYAFDFAIEAFVVLFWLAVRIDKRFYVPDGAKGPSSYGGGYVFAGEPGNEKIALGNRESMRHLVGSSSTAHLQTASSSNTQLPTEPRSARSSMAARRHSRGSSMAKDNRVSWGGLSRVDITDTLAEDGEGYVPYSGYTGQALGQELEEMTAGDVGVDGVEAEMGWDRKSGKWILRPLSTTPSSSALLRPAASFSSPRGSGWN